MLNKRWYNKYLVLCQPRNQDDNELTSHHARCSEDMVSLLEAWGWLQSTENCLYGRISGWMVQKGPWVKRGQTMASLIIIYQNGIQSIFKKFFTIYRLLTNFLISTLPPVIFQLRDWVLFTLPPVIITVERLCTFFTDFFSLCLFYEL